MNDYWNCDSIIASEFELKTTHSNLQLWKVIPLLDQIQIQIPQMYQLPDFDSNPLLNLNSLHVDFWNITLILASKMYIRLIVGN